MDLTVGLVFIVVFLISYFIVTKPKNLPPGPTGLPLLGSWSLLKRFKQEKPHLALMEAAKKYGNVMSVRFGKRLFVVLTGYDAVHEALVKQADVFSDRPTLQALDQGKKLDSSSGFHDSPEFVARLRNKGIIFHKYGHSWRTLRRFTLQSLRDFGVGKTSIEEKIFTELDVVTEAFQKSGGLPISTSNYTQKLVGNVLLGIVFGKRYDYDDPEFDKVRTMLSTITTGNGFLSARQMLPKFIAQLLVKKDTENEKIRMKSLRWTRQYIADEVKAHEETFDPDNIRDFVDIFLQTKQDSESDKENIDEASMFRVIMDLFLAGQETTFNTLDWAFLYMSEFPDVQSRCQREIQQIFGDKPVQYSDRGKLTYTQATIMEVQRCATLAPLSVIHCTTRDTTLMGHHIPANTAVLPSLYSVQNDPKHWKQPEKFMPERFIDKAGKLIKHDAFMPFSTGPRMCLGEPLAKMELFLVFANLLQRFTFCRQTEGVPHTLDPKPYNITHVPIPYSLRVTKIN